MEISLPQFFLRYGWTSATVVDLIGDPQLCERLYEMGLHKGLTIELKGRAPWGGPWIVEFKTTSVALRQEEAESLLLKVKESSL